MFCPKLYPYIEKDFKKEWNGRICSNEETCGSKNKDFVDGDKFFESSNGCHALCP